MIECFAPLATNVIVFMDRGTKARTCPHLHLAGCIMATIMRYRFSWILTVSFLSVGATLDAAETQSATRPNVILITIDTLRADHLGCYGDKEAETPSIDGLAGDGVQFDHASVHVPLTLPSHSSIMTGVYPPLHGVRDNIGYTLAEDQITLAELLKEAGYETGGFVGGFVLDSKTGINQGFDHYSDDFGIDDSNRPKFVNLGYVERRGDKVVGDALTWMQGRKNLPFFAWIHLFDPHDPYRPPEPFKTKFQGPAAYRGEIAYTDAMIGKVFEWLKGEQLYDDSLVVLTSDHGESLGEHGEPTHGLFVYESVLRVPLIVKWPGQRYAGTKIADPTQSIDILPTVLQSLRLNKPPAAQGIGLLSIVTSKAAPRRIHYAESLYPRTQLGWSALRSVREGKFKYIQAPRAELYDLSADPKELQNLVHQNKSMANRLQTSLKDLRNRLENQKPTQPKQVDPQTMAKLRALGYVSSGAGAKVAGLADEDLADPKDKVDVYKTVLMELRGANTTEGKERIHRLETMLKKDPNLTLALSFLGEAYLRAGDYDKALSNLKKSLAIRPWDETLMYLIAYCYLQNNEVDASIVGFKQILGENPTHHGANINLGIALTKQNNLDQAIEQFTRALREKPGDPQGHEGLGYAYLKKGLLDEATGQFESALTSDPKMAKAHLWMGYCHLERAKRFQQTNPTHPRIPGLVGQARQAFATALELESGLRSKVPPSFVP